MHFTHTVKKMSDIKKLYVQRYFIILISIAIFQFSVSSHAVQVFTCSQVFACSAGLRMQCGSSQIVQVFTCSAGSHAVEVFTCSAGLCMHCSRRSLHAVQVFICSAGLHMQCMSSPTVQVFTCSAGLCMQCRSSHAVHIFTNSAVLCMQFRSSQAVQVFTYSSVSISALHIMLLTGTVCACTAYFAASLLAQEEASLDTIYKMLDLKDLDRGCHNFSIPMHCSLFC